MRLALQNRGALLGQKAKPNKKPNIVIPGREIQETEEKASRVLTKSRNWTYFETQARHWSHEVELSARKLNRAQNIYVEVCIP